MSTNLFLIDFILLPKSCDCVFFIVSSAGASFLLVSCTLEPSWWLVLLIDGFMPFPERGLLFCLQLDGLYDLLSVIR